MSICGSISDQTVTLGQLRVNKNRANSSFILFNFIHLRFFFHKKLIPIESNGEHPCGIFQWALKREKNKNIVTFFAYDKIISILLMSKIAKKLTKRAVLKILLLLKCISMIA